MSAAHDVLRAVGPFAGLAAGVLLATRRRVVREFQSRRAVTPAAGITFQPSSTLQRFWVRKFLRTGELKRTDERYWLDEQVWAKYRLRRMTCALTIAVIALAILAIVAVVNFRP